MASGFWQSFKNSAAMTGTSACALLSGIGTISSATNGETSSMPFLLGATTLISMGGMTISGLISSENRHPSLTGKIAGGTSGIVAGCAATALVAGTSVYLDEGFKISATDNENILIAEEPSYPALDHVTFG